MLAVVLLVAVLLGVAMVAGLWRIAGSVDALAGALSSRALGDRAKGAENAPAVADSQPPVADLSSKLDELTEAVWALQSISASPQRPPYRFDRQLHADEAARRVEILKTVEDVYAKRFHSDELHSEDEHQAISSALEDTGNLFDKIVYDNLIALENNSSVLMGRGARLMAVDDGSLDSKRYESMYSLWKKVQEQMAERIAADDGSKAGSL